MIPAKLRRILVAVNSAFARATIARPRDALELRAAAYERLSELLVEGQKAVKAEKRRK